MAGIKTAAVRLAGRVRPVAGILHRLREKRTEFYQFQKKVHPDTWANHESVLRWADSCLSNREEIEAEGSYERSSDPLVRQGWALKKRIETEYRDRHSDWKDLRILLHRPDYERSVGGYSLFNNLLLSLQFMGIAARVFGPRDEFAAVLDGFRPTILLTSDNERDLAAVNWSDLDAYRAGSRCALGLTASLEEYGNTPLPGRLAWARAHGVDFYYSFSPQDYLRGRADYAPFWNEGYEILSYEFGANVLTYYPVPGIPRDLAYVFLGSRNKSKWDRYTSFFGPICREYPGFIHGGGWLKIKDQSVNMDRDRYLYSQARICLNLHTRYEVQWPFEVNERTYMIAACGAPMLIDNPAYLPSIFPAGSVFSASTPDDYFELFRFMLANPEEVQRRTLAVQLLIMEKYNSFKRAEDFASHLRRFAVNTTSSPPHQDG